MLRLLVPFMPGETTASFCARLAIRNACRNAREFCRLLGLSFRNLVTGDPQEIAHLADLSGVNPDTIDAGTTHRLQPGYFSVNGEVITKPMLRRATVRICPHCLSDDIADRPDLGKLAVFQRLEWQISAFRRCDIHGTALIEIFNELHPSKSNDFSVAVLSRLENLPLWSTGTPDLPRSQFEEYVRRRINGVERPPIWLDRFRLYAAARLCETIGLLSRFGPRVQRSNVSEIDLHAAGDEGFMALQAGPISLGHFLDRLIEAGPTRKTPTGLKTLFGGFNIWLSSETDPEYEVAREAVREHVLTRFAFDPGENVFGRPLETRRLWSVQAAKHMTGQHHQRLRRLIAEAGFTPADTTELSDERVVFPASPEADAFLCKVRGAMTIKGTGRYIGAPRVQMEILVNGGFIQPFISLKRDVDSWDHMFAQKDADTFLKKLMANAKDGDMEAFFDIPTAVRKTHKTTASIVRLLADGKLKRVRRNPSAQGYLSIMVDPGEIRRHLPADANRPLSCRQVSKLTHRPDFVIKALVTHGYLKGTVVKRRILVHRHDLAKFTRTYVHLYDLAAEIGIHMLAIKKKLSMAGIYPAFDPELVKANFYVRAAAERFFISTTQ